MNNDLNNGVNNGVFNSQQVNGQVGLNNGTGGNVFNQQQMNNQQLNNQMASNNIDANKSGKKKIVVPIIIVLVLILLGGGGFAAYKLFLSNPKFLYAQTLNGLYDGVFETINDSSIILYDGEKDKLDLKFGIEFEPNSDNLKEVFKYEDNSLSSVSADLSFGVDSIDKKVNFNADYKENNSSLVNGSILLTADKLHLYSKNLYDKSVMVNAEDIGDSYSENFENVFNFLKEVKIKENSGNLVKTIDKLKEIYMNNIEKYGKYSLNNEGVNINDTEYKLKKVSYELTGDNYVKFSDGMLNDIKNNDELLNLIVSILNDKNVTKQTLIEAIDESIEYNKEYGSEDTITVAFYYNGIFNKFSGFCVTIDDYKLEYYSIDNNYSVHIADNYDDYKLVGTKENSDLYKFALYENNNLSLNIEMKKIANGNFDVIFTQDNDGSNISVKINCKVDTTSDKKFKITIAAETSINDGQEDYLFNINLDVEANIVDNLDLFDTQNSIEISEVSQEDISNISSKFMSSLDKSVIYNMLSSALNDGNSSIDTYDYSTDDYSDFDL